MSQKSNSELRIDEDDLYTYFIQKNLWPKMYFEEFEEKMEAQGVIIENKRGF